MGELVRKTGGQLVAWCGSPRRRSADRLLTVTGLVRMFLAALSALGFFVISSSGTAPAGAEEWGGIEPGVTPMQDVRERFGAPSKETHAKVEGYNTTEWVYEDARAPGGIKKMTVSFGLLTPQGYKPTLVRMLRLEPQSMVFGRATVIQGYGVPDGTSMQNDQEVFFYKSGLLATLDKAGEEAVLLTFTPPQLDVSPPPSSPAAPKR